MKHHSQRYLITSIIYYTALGTAIVYILFNGSGAEYNNTVGFMALITIIWCAITSRHYSGTALSLLFMFEASFYILTLGQSLFYALNIEINSIYKGLDLYYTNPAYAVNNAYLFTIICLNMINIGAVTWLSKRKPFFTLKTKNITLDEISRKTDFTSTMRTVGWLLFALSIIPYMYEAIQLINVYAVYGYRAAYGSISGTTSWGKSFGLLGRLFPYVLFMLLAAYRYEKKGQFFIINIILGLILFNFAIGNRSEPICYLMALLWFSKKYTRSEHEKHWMTLVMIAGAVLLILIFPIIGEVRNTGELSFKTVTDSFIGATSSTNSIKDAIIGMGWSAFPTVKTMQLIPDQFDYHFGQSYFFALLSIFPNIIGGTHISVKYAGLAQWLMNTLNMSYGPGFSMPAEAYYNFGWLGILVMPIIGRIIAKILDESDKQETALRLFIMMGCFVILFTIPRRDMLTAIRTIVYNIGFICIAVYMYRKYAHR